MKKVTRLTAILLCIAVIFSLPGCGTKDFNGAFSGSTNCGNIMMGQGKFAQSGDFIYFTEQQNIYEYDIISQNTVVLYPNYDIVNSLFVEDRYIYYCDAGIKRISKSGDKIQSVIPIENGCSFPFADGKVLYYLDSIGGKLFAMDIESRDTSELLDNVIFYFVDNIHVYAIENKNDICTLYKSRKEKISFEPVSLNFNPISVYSDNDSLYLSTANTYEIVKIKDGSETPLNIASTYYQVLGNTLYFMDAHTFANSCFTLKAYDLETGEISDISKGAFDFGITGDRYVTIQQSINAGVKFVLYDVTTTKTVDMTFE